MTHLSAANPRSSPAHQRSQAIYAHTVFAPRSSSESLAASTLLPCLNPSHSSAPLRGSPLKTITCNFRNGFLQAPVSKVIRRSYFLTPVAPVRRRLAPDTDLRLAIPYLNNTFRIQALCVILRNLAEQTRFPQRSWCACSCRLRAEANSKGCSACSAAECRTATGAHSRGYTSDLSNHRVLTALSRRRSSPRYRTRGG